MTAASSKNFLRSVGVLVRGTVIAQLITAAALWYATQVYTPRDFSVLAQFTAMVSTLGVAAALRFDLAIPLPEQRTDAAAVLALALALSAATAAVVGVAGALWGGRIVALLNQPALEPYIWLIALGVLIMGFYSSLQLWFIREKGFSMIARVRIAQSASGGSVQSLMGLVNPIPLGLMLGQTASNGMGCLLLGYRLLAKDAALLRTVTVGGMRAMFKTYDRFPKFSTFEALFNNAGMQVPIIMIGAVALGPEAGYLLLAMSVMQAPMSLIGTAVSQVYLSEAPAEHQQQRLDAFTAKVLTGLCKSGVGPLLFAGIVAPSGFTLVFGVEWHRAGVLVAWMTPWFIFCFLAAPVSMALHVTGSQRMALALQAFGLVLRCGFVYLASEYARPLVSEAYAVSGMVFYLAYLAVVMAVVGMTMRQVFDAVRQSALPILAWTAAGAAVALLAGAILP